LAAFFLVEATNQHSKQMTIRQKLTRTIYPLLMQAGRLFGANAHRKSNPLGVDPSRSIYSLKVKMNNGSELDLSTLRGKKILLVNTASACGYTPQYDELQKLYEDYPGRLVILGFPSNDFGEQEKGNDEEIAQFCQLNFGVSFPLASKSRVTKSSEQNSVFEWLSHKEENGWNDQAPVWNFSKYLVNEEGLLTNYFDPGVSPLAPAVRTAIEMPDTKPVTN
jgi:glutathione peroxidase